MRTKLNFRAAISLRLKVRHEALNFSAEDENLKQGELIPPLITCRGSEEMFRTLELHIYAPHELTGCWFRVGTLRVNSKELRSLDLFHNHRNVSSNHANFEVQLHSKKLYLR